MGGKFVTVGEFSVLRRGRNYLGVLLRHVLHVPDNCHMSISMNSGVIPEMNTLPNRLRVARDFAGMSQGDLAERAELSRTTVSAAEAGLKTPARATITVWAFACGVDVEWLRTGNETAPSPDGDGADDPSRLRESNPRPIHYKPSAFSLVAE